jgi:hypothetical protein
MTLYEYLQRQGEHLPGRLAQLKPGDPFSRDQFFASRVVFYPGSGTDGHPVKLFGSTHSAHSFVYADYGKTQPVLEAKLGHHQHGFRGYHALARLQLRESDLVPRGWTAHVEAGDLLPDRYRGVAVADSPFGFLEVLERDEDLDENHGARRLAILFLGADGFATYDALFCQGHGDSAPFAVVLQDHGFGENYDEFGRDGLLERIARRCDVLPPWLLVAENTHPWQGFERVPDLNGDHGGMHDMLRFLYERREE